jgi:ribosomal protein S18 acetylase RimI-like enzyme
MAIDYTISLHRRPNAAPPDTAIVSGILDITRSLTGTWFTANVPGDTLNDLKFHDVLCLHRSAELLSFLVFTSWDGMLHITLMGTRPEARGQGFGSRVIEDFFRQARQLGFEKCAVMTVPEDVNPLYQGTIHFYQKHGFMIEKRYRELWEHGAVRLVKRL